MTSQSDRIQSLVGQINTILHNASADGEPMVDEYQVLAQTRQQLMQLQGAPLPPMSPSAEANETAVVVQEWSAPAPVLAESAQQVLQAVVQEMAYLRMNTVQPLREEIVRLQQERNYLVSEVQQLQHQRYQLVLAQQTDQQQMINGFLHALMERLQEQLTLQVAQTIAQLEGRSGTTLVSAGDAKVMQLDSTLQVVFDSLQSNINTHQVALEESLQKMQGLGQQGEAMFTAFVNRLASRLGQEASQYLQSPSQPVSPLSSPSISSPSMSAAGPFDVSGMSGAMDSGQLAPDRPDNLLSQPITDAQMDEGIATGLPMADGVTETWVGEPVDQRLDPAVDAMAPDAIAPLDALEVVDNLDLGFGLDAVELADVPTDQTALSALLQEADPTRELTAEIASSVLTPDNPAQSPLGDAEQNNGEESADELSSPILAPPEGLTAPLQPIATLQIDNDEVDVDRLLNVINASSNADADDPPAAGLDSPPSPMDSSIDNPGEFFPEPSGVGEPGENDPDAVDLLRQELAAELRDEMIDEQLFGSNSEPELPEAVLAAVDPLPTVPRQDSSISFAIKSPSSGSESWDNDVENSGESDRPSSEFGDDLTAFGDDLAPSTASPSDPTRPDFYGAFVDSIDPTHPAAVQSDDPDILELTAMGDADEHSAASASDWGIPGDDSASDRLTPEDTTTTPSDEWESTVGTGNSVAASAAASAATSAATSAAAASAMVSNIADGTSNPDPGESDDGIDDSWSQWIDDAEVSISTLPEADESDEANLSAWLGPDESDAAIADQPPGKDTIHRLTDLTQGLSANTESVNTESATTESATTESAISGPSNLSSETTLQDHEWMEPSTDLFADGSSLRSPDPMANRPEDLFNDLSSDRPTDRPNLETEAGADANTGPDADSTGLTPVSSMLGDLFSSDSPTDDPPAPAQAIAKPISSLFIADPIADPLDPPESSEEDAPLFEQFEQPEIDSPKTDDSAASLFAEAPEADPLAIQQDNLAEQAEETGFASLLEELQQDDLSPSSALTDAEEAKTLADLLRSQNAYIGQQPSNVASEESRATPPTVPSDSDPFSNWFGAEGDDMEETGDAQKKNNE